MIYFYEKNENTNKIDYFRENKEIRWGNIKLLEMLLFGAQITLSNWLILVFGF